MKHLSIDAALFFYVGVTVALHEALFVSGVMMYCTLLQKELFFAGETHLPLTEALFFSGVVIPAGFSIDETPCLVTDALRLFWPGEWSSCMVHNTSEEALITRGRSIDTHIIMTSPTEYYYYTITTVMNLHQIIIY